MTKEKSRSPLTDPPGHTLAGKRPTKVGLEWFKQTHSQGQIWRAAKRPPRSAPDQLPRLPREASHQGGSSMDPNHLGACEAASQGFRRPAAQIGREAGCQDGHPMYLNYHSQMPI